MDKTDARYWEWRANTGQKKRMNPEQLWECALEYIDWAEKNPFLKPELIKGGDLAGAVVNVKCPRIWTWQGLSIFTGKKYNVFDLGRHIENTDNLYAEFVPTIGAIRALFDEQKLAGVNSNQFNPLVVARLMSLSDKVEQKVTATVNPIDYSKLSNKALEEILNARTNGEQSTNKS